MALVAYLRYYVGMKPFSVDSIFNDDPIDRTIGGNI
jgi:hypothetical protein